MIVGVPKESYPGERRVALTPLVVPLLTKAGLEVVLEPGAGEQAGYPDAQYQGHGAKILPERGTVFAQSDIILQVLCHGANDKTGTNDLSLMRRGQVLIGFLRPLGSPDSVQQVAKTGVSAYAVELMPRITRAQSMDALSSMASIAGYKAVVLVANELPRIFPMMTTAAGTITPSRVLVIGAGVAGLQAIATAKRLGAVVTAFDVRAVVKEQVESLGARFLELDLEADGEGAGGYAKELAEEQQQRQREALADAAGRFDVAITTAQIPGRRAPLLLTAQAVENMKPGAVIVDMAGESGGNCELTEPGQTVERHGVKIIAPVNLPGEMPDHASQLYARNVAALLELMVKDGDLALDFDDEVIAGACVTRGGEIVHEGAKQAAGAPAA
jgi:NAD(P) transhydrogenase subunit alpha